MSRLDEYRAEIAEIDEKIITLIAERNAVARKIGKEKQQLGMPVIVPDVEEKVEKRYKKSAENHGVSEGTASVIARAVIDEAVAIQQETSSKH